MALPNRLKYFNVFTDGYSHLGECKEIELPKLARKMEDYRGAGMDGPVKLDQGQEGLEMTITYGGLVRDALKAYGSASVTGVLLRFAGSYQAEDGSAAQAVEIVARGRYQELDFGKGKAGEENEFKAKAALAYYRLTIDGEDMIEMEPINLVNVVNGVDILAEHRANIGA